MCPLLFVPGAVHVQSIRYMLRDINWEPLTLCTWRYVYKKYKVDVKRRQSGVPSFLYMLVH
jgi:hypothetical protein